MHDHRFEALDDLIGTTLGEDWGDEFDSPYDALDDRFDAGLSADSLRSLVHDIDRLHEESRTASDRVRAFQVYAFRDRPEEFDAWLGAVRRRAVEALAGDCSNPLTAPPG